MAMIHLTIDGKAVEVEEGSTVLDASVKAGAWIPTLCFQEGMAPYGACRVCTVEVVQNGRSRLQASCALPAVEGMEVHTASERVTRGRKVIVELLLARAPGVPALLELAEKLGVDEVRFPERHDDCILCGLCVRVCAEIMGVGAIGFSGRGTAKKVETPFDDPSDVCQACGACTYVCPTGKMQMEADRAGALRKLAGVERQCRYARMGFFASKICHNHFECWHCDVDQAMEDAMGTHPAIDSAPGREGVIREVGGFPIAPLLHYHDRHSWVQVFEDRAQVGIDGFASRLLGPVTEIDFPKIGRAYAAGEEAFTIHSGSRSASFPLPVAGTVLEVNRLLLDDPASASKAPFTRGWIAVIAPHKLRPELTRLRFRQTAILWLEKERDRLMSSHAKEGESLADLLARIDEAAWPKLREDFFLS